MKRYLTIFIMMIVCFTFVGCAHENNTPTHESLEHSNSTNVESSEECTEDLTEDSTEIPTIDLYQNAIWKKDRQELLLNTVYFSKDWDQYIMVGDEQVVSDKKTDVFELPNYFYLEGESFTDLETIYYVPTYRYNLSSTLTQFDTHVRSVLHVYSTSDLATHPHGAVIESIQYLAVINPNEGGLTSLMNMVKYDDGQFGFGSLKKDVEAVLGLPTNSFIEEMSNGINLTTDVYIGEKATLAISYMWLKSDNEENAVLTTIKWDLTEIANYLHSQEGADMFEGRDIDASKVNSSPN